MRPVNLPSPVLTCRWKTNPTFFQRDKDVDAAFVFGSSHAGTYKTISIWFTMDYIKDVRHLFLTLVQGMLPLFWLPAADMFSSTPLIQFQISSSHPVVKPFKPFNPKSGQAMLKILLPVVVTLHFGREIITFNRQKISFCRVHFWHYSHFQVCNIFDVVSNLQFHEALTLNL